MNKRGRRKESVPGDVCDHSEEQDHDEEDGDTTGCSDQLPHGQPDGHHGERQRVRPAIRRQETCHKRRCLLWRRRVLCLTTRVRQTAVTQSKPMHTIDCRSSSSKSRSCSSERYCTTSFNLLKWHTKVPLSIPSLYVLQSYHELRSVRWNRWCSADGTKRVTRPARQRVMRTDDTEKAELTPSM